MEFNLSPTISSGGMNSILNALQQMGIDIEILKKDVGLDDGILSDNDARLSCHLAVDCYRKSSRSWKGDNFGLAHGSKYQPFNLGIVGHLVATSTTCLQALQSYENYQRAFGEGMRFSLRSHLSPTDPKEGYAAELVIHPEMVCDMDSSLIDSFFVALKRCVSLLTSENAPFLKVELQRPEPADASAYSLAFGCPVFFSQNKDQALLPAELLERHLLTSNPVLYEMLENQSGAIIKRIGSGDSFSISVMREIAKCIDGKKIDVARIAERLSVSPRTLQRRLKEDASNFQTLLDEVRVNFAKEQLKLNRMGIDEQAYLLAFSEPGIYRKAFKRWTGKTPTEYKRSLEKFK